jgi:hypothetical protein
MTIGEVISNGKLKSYHHGGGFLEVYWQHFSLEPTQYYLFLFTGLQCKFISVKIIAPDYMPIKRKPKIFIPMIESLMAELKQSTQTI